MLLSPKETKYLIFSIKQRGGDKVDHKPYISDEALHKLTKLQPKLPENKLKTITSESEYTLEQSAFRFNVFVAVAIICL